MPLASLSIAQIYPNSSYIECFNARLFIGSPGAKQLCCIARHLALRANTDPENHWFVEAPIPLHQARRWPLAFRLLRHLQLLRTRPSGPRAQEIPFSLWEVEGPIGPKRAKRAWWLAVVEGG